MKRRNFLLFTAVGAATIGIPLGLRYLRRPTDKKALAQPRYLSYLCDANTVREIGTAYRKQVPGESTPDQLVDVLLEDVPLQTFLPSSDASAVPAYLRNKTTRDFEAGRTVIVKGWVLAVTEARQCALFSLLPT